jgi:hypothetical protein
MPYVMVHLANISMVLENYNDSLKDEKLNQQAVVVMDLISYLQQKFVFIKNFMYINKFVDGLLYTLIYFSITLI